MNNVMKRLIEHLLHGDILLAIKEAEVFPEFYGSKLLDKNGELTEFGLLNSLEYPFPRKLGNLLSKCYYDQLSSAHIQIEFEEFDRVFRLVEKNSTQLSKQGIVKAIQALPLIKQCKALGISYDTIQLNSSKETVEQLVSNHFRQAGYSTANLEGGDIIVLLRCAAWNKFHSIAEEKDTPYLEALLVDSDDPSMSNKNAVDTLINGISESNLGSTLDAFRSIYPNSSLSEIFPRMSENYIAELYKSIGADLLSEIAKLFSTDPYQFRKGWPDLTVIKPSSKDQHHSNERLVLKEVKVKDKLHTSQIITIIELVKLIPNIGVMKVEYGA